MTYTNPTSPPRRWRLHINCSRFRESRSPHPSPPSSLSSSPGYHTAASLRVETGRNAYIEPVHHQRRQGSEVRGALADTKAKLSLSRPFIHHVLSTTSRCCRIPYTTRRSPVSPRSPAAVESYGIQARVRLRISRAGDLRTGCSALVSYGYDSCSRNVPNPRA